MKDFRSLNKNNSITKTESLIIFIPIVIIILFVSFFAKCVSSKDYYDHYLKNDIYNGLIIDKYQDFDRHGIETLILLKDNKQTELNAGDWENLLWDSCSIGDYIYKDKGDLQLHLIKIKKSDTILINYNQNKSGFTIMNRFK